MTIHSATASLKPVRSPNLGEVAVVGLHESRQLMFDLSPEVPIWTLNSAESYDFPRIDALFEMHPLSNIILETPRIENLKIEHDYPIYMLKEYPFFPSSVEYPREVILSEVFKNVFLGTQNAKYMDSSIPYMIALAEKVGYKTIYLYGFGLETDTEYTYQRPGAFGLIMWAAGRGVKIVLPENSGLMPDTEYGFEEYQSISRQNCEQWLKDIQIQESDWVGKLNVMHERVVQLERLEGPVEEITEAQESRNDAFKQMYMRQGAINMLLQQIKIMDRKRDAMSEFEFEDHFFIATEGEEITSEAKAVGTQ